MGHQGGHRGPDTGKRTETGGENEPRPSGSGPHQRRPRAPTTSHRPQPRVGIHRPAPTHTQHKKEGETPPHTTNDTATHGGPPPGSEGNATARTPREGYPRTPTSSNGDALTAAHSGHQRRGGGHPPHYGGPANDTCAPMGVRPIHPKTQHDVTQRDSAPRTSPEAPPPPPPHPTTTTTSTKTASPQEHKAQAS